MPRVGEQQNETLRMWHEMQKKSSTPVKTNNCKASSLFDKAGNIT